MSLSCPSSTLVQHVPVPEFTRNTALSLYVSALTISFLSCVVFVVMKNRYTRTRLRRSLLVGTIFACGIMTYNADVLPLALLGTRYELPCWFVRANMLLAPSLTGAVSYARSAGFILLTRFSRATMLYGRVREKAIPEFDSTSQAIRWYASVLKFAFTSLFHPDVTASTVSNEEVVFTLQALRWLSGRLGIISLVACVFAPWIVINLLIAFLLPDPFCTGCIRPLDSIISIIFLVEVAIFMIPTVITAKKARVLPDPWGLFRETRINLIFLTIAIVGAILNWQDPTPTLLPGYSTHVWLEVFGFTAFLVFDSTGQVLIAAYRETPRVHLHEVGTSSSSRVGSRIDDTTTNGEHGEKMIETTMTVQGIRRSPNLVKIINNYPSAYPLLQNYVVRELCTENLLFLEETGMGWLGRYDSLTPPERVKIAKELVTMFVGSAALYQINISSTMENALQQVLSIPDHGHVDITIFDLAREECALMLEGGPVSRFLLTKEWLELIATDAVVSAVV